MGLQGIKDINTIPPSSVGTFHGGCPAGFVEIENRKNYSLVISKWGLGRVVKSVATEVKVGIFPVTEIATSAEGN